MTTEGKLKRSRNPLDFDFTEPEALTRYVTETGKILPHKHTHVHTHVFLVRERDRA